MTSGSRLPSRRLVAALAVVSTAGGIAVGAAVGQLPGTPPPPPEVAPVLTQGPAAEAIAAVDRPLRRGDGLDPAILAIDADALDALRGMARLEGARLASSREGHRVYLAPAVQRGAICIIVVQEGVGMAAANCPPRRVVASGQAVLGVSGGPGGPWTLAGVVPDGVQSVSDGTATTAVEGNTFVYTRTGPAPQSRRFRLRDGRERVVPVP